MALVGELRSFLKDGGIEDGPCMTAAVSLGEDKTQWRHDGQEGVIWAKAQRWEDVWEIVMFPLSLNIYYAALGRVRQRNKA